MTRKTVFNAVSYIGSSRRVCDGAVSLTDCHKYIHFLRKPIQIAKNIEARERREAIGTACF